MNMYERLKQEKIIALKEKNQIAKRVIPYVMGIANDKAGAVGANSGKVISNDVVYAAISKVIADNDALLLNQSNEKLESESAYLKTLLPTVYTESQLIEVINSYEFDSIGAYMKAISVEHAGKVDKAMASKIIAQKLQK
ncbi:hypothetical protein LMH73_015885 [Vibrio splendidus]|nr:hypothetical protein [Vibrio splendidus]MCC4881455.1 hypothetical protein [Vibrio splendidus]